MGIGGAAQESGLSPNLMRAETTISQQSEQPT